MANLAAEHDTLSTYILTKGSVLDTCAFSIILSSAILLIFISKSSPAIFLIYL
jgi:hypothetical protein